VFVIATTSVDLSSFRLHHSPSSFYLWPLLVFHMTLGMFASSRKRYMVSNKHFVLSLRKFLLWSLLLDLFLVVIILIFFKYTNAGRIIMSLYVDDMIITGNDIYDILVLKIELVRLTIYTTKLSFIYLSHILFRNLLLIICITEKTLSTIAVSTCRSNDNLINIYIKHIYIYIQFEKLSNCHYLFLPFFSQD
jgi:hypothetical protein